MRFSTRAYFLLFAMLAVVLLRMHAGDQFEPPPLDLPDPIDFPLDPPDPWDDPFDPINGLPLPEIPDFPPESDMDPFDDQFPLPDPPGLEDPFPDLEPSLFPGDLNGGEQLGYSPAEAGLAYGPHARAAAAVTNTVTPLMQFPRRLWFSPQGTVSAGATRLNCSAGHQTLLILPESKRNSVAFMNTCPVALTGRLTVGMKPVNVTRIPDSQSALVSNSGDGTISVVNLASRTVSSTITLPSVNGLTAQPSGIAILPDGSRAYVTSHSCEPGSVVFIIDMSSLKVTGNIPVGCFPSSIKATPDGSQIWVSQRGDSRLDIFDTATNARVFGYNLQFPFGVAFNPAGTRAYIAEGDAAGAAPGDIAVVDMSSYKVITRITVGNLPHAVLVTPTGRHVFVTNALSNSISQIDTATNKVLRTIKLKGKHPLGLSFVAKSPF